MVFCGQCGLQVPPGKTACPRCGTPTEPEFDLVPEDPRAYDPTLAALPSYEPDYQRTVGTSTSLQQQKLVLRPDGNDHNFSGQAVNDPTSMMNAQGYAGYQDYPAHVQRTPILPPSPNIDMSYPGYTPQTSQIDKGYQPIAGQYGGTTPAQAPVRKGKGRTVALLLILFSLLVILGALSLIHI